MEITQEITKEELISHIGSYKEGEYPFHWHENFELCMPIKNKCSFLIDGKLIEAKEGDIIAIRERSVHSLLVKGEKVDVRIIQFPIRILLGVEKRIDPLKTYITSEEINSIKNLRQDLGSLIEIADKEYCAEKAQDNPYLQSIISSIYLLLMRHFPTDEKNIAKKNDRKEFYKIAEYVNEHFKEEINVSIIANKLYIPRGRLASLFSRYAGMGLNYYINALRIKNVNQMLGEGKRITEAAIESGFQSIRTFNNAYKEYMGITPTEYVKKYTNAK